MNILILDSWLREYLKTQASSEKISKCLSLCGPSVEKLTKVDNDWLYDIEVTTNRVDLMSVIGIAREAAAILPRFSFKAVFKNLILRENKQVTNKLDIKITDPQNTCQRILGVIIDNVKIGPSPEQIRKRLNASGVRSLNNLIDITNYVMLEVGHPTHVFDYDRLITKKLIFRKAKKGEKIISLENKSYTLPGGDIVIDNGKGEIIDLPGIIGTANSVVTGNTKRILFFIENSNPQQIRKSSMTLGIRTLAATINEKSVSPDLAKIALYRGIQLYQNLTGGQQASKIYDIYPNPVKPNIIQTPINYLNNILGFSLKPDKIINILNSLSIKSQIEHKKQKEIISIIPHWRYSDLKLPEDIIEEVARIYGYHNLPGILMSGQLPKHSFIQTKQFYLETKIKNYLTDWGYTETYTYSMQGEEEIQKSGLLTQSHLKISNPLSKEWKFLRTSIIPSLLNIIKSNLNQKDNFNIFELSNIYNPQKENLPNEKMFLAVIKSGENQFYYLKGLVEELFNQLGVNNYSFIHSEKIPNYYQENQVLVVKKDKIIIGYLGMISQKILYNWKIDKPLAAIELDFANIVNGSTLTKTYTPISTYPPMIEDFSFNFPNTIQLGEILSVIKKISSYITDITILDKYESTITFRLTFQDFQKSLTVSDIVPLRKKLARELKEKFKATIKGKI